MAQLDSPTYWILFVVIFLALTALLALSVYSVAAAIRHLAHQSRKRFFAPVPTAGTFAFCVLEGRVQRIIENVHGWALDHNGRFTPSKMTEKAPGFLGESLGVTWIGFFPTIAVFAESKWPTSQSVTLVQPKQGLAVSGASATAASVSEFSFYVPYSLVIRDIELKGNIQVNLTAVVSLLFVNPVRAYFSVQDPVRLFGATVKSAVRSWMSTKDFNEVKEVTVTENKSAEQMPGFWDMLETLNGITIPDGRPDYETEKTLGLYGKLGVIIIGVELEQLEAVGAAASALEQAYLTELRGRAKVVEAKISGEAAIISADARLQVAARDAAAQRTLNEQNAGYFATLPDGARMYVAHRLADRDSSVTVWVEGNARVPAPLPVLEAPEQFEEPKRKT
jgi:hypothetical protein